MDLHKEVFFIRNLLLLLTLVLGLFLMKNLYGILLPLFLALFLSIIYIPLVLYLERKKIPTGLIVALIAVITLGAILSVANIIIATVNDIVSQTDFLVSQLQNKSLALAEFLTSMPYLNLDLNTIQEGMGNFLNLNLITSTARGFLKGAGSFGSSFLMFTLYFLFLLPGLSRYQHYLRYVGNNRESILEDYEIIQKKISTYMLIKLFLSLFTGTVTYLICTILGLEFAFFWGFLTVVLNFIPSIGSIIATIIPSLFGIIYFDEYQRMLILAILLGANQIIIGNFLDPRIMGNRLRLNTVTVLFGLVFWGVIWGIPGMLLSVPLMVTLKLILEKSQTWSILARIMGNPESQEKPLKRAFFDRKKKKTTPDD